MPTPLRVLFIEDSEDDATLQVRLLRQAGFSAPEAHSVEGMPSQFLVAGRADGARTGGGSVP